MRSASSKLILSDNHIDALAVSNPFVLFDAGGNAIVSSSAQEAYLKLLHMIHSVSPRGFLDLPLFMVKFQRIGLKQAERICGARQYAVIDWDPLKGEERIQVLRIICEKMLQVSKIPFDSRAFYGALTRFNESAIVESLTKRKLKDEEFDPDLVAFT